MDTQQEEYQNRILEEKFKTKKWKIHFFYVTLILILIIVVTFAYFFNGNDQLVLFIGFAATLSSIILSVLAIFITASSSNETSGFMHKIRDISENISGKTKEMSGASDKLKGTLDGISHLKEDVTTSVSEMKKVSTDLKTSMEDRSKVTERIESAADNLEVSTKSLSNSLTLMQSIADKIEAIEDFQKENFSNLGKSISGLAIGKMATSGDGKGIVGQASEVGIVLIYVLAKLSQAKNVKGQNIVFQHFNLFEGMDGVLDGDYSEYAWGYFICLRSNEEYFRIVRIEDSSIYRIDYIAPKIISEINDKMNSDEFKDEKFKADELVQKLIEESKNIESKPEEK